MIDTIIFDVGNVLAVADWPKVFASMGIPEKNFQEVADATVYNALWHEYDRGSISENEIVQKFIDNAPYLKTEILKIFSQLDKIVEVCDYAQDWIMGYKAKGFKVYILSNFPEKAFEACRDKFTFLKNVDGEIVSYKYHEIKPEKELYQRLESVYHVIPKNSIFIDDLEDNILGARKCGYYGVVFKNKEQADKEIERICQSLQSKN